MTWNSLPPTRPANPIIQQQWTHRCFIIADIRMEYSKAQTGNQSLRLSDHITSLLVCDWLLLVVSWPPHLEFITQRRIGLISYKPMADDVQLEELLSSFFVSFAFTTRRGLAMWVCKVCVKRCRRHQFDKNVGFKKCFQKATHDSKWKSSCPI